MSGLNSSDLNNNFFKSHRFCPFCGSPFSGFKDDYGDCPNNHRFYNSPKPCGCIIAKNSEGEILLVRRKSDPYMGYWDLPGGFVKPGESIENGLKREILEEIGADLTIELFVGTAADVYMWNGVAYPVISSFFAGSINSNSISVNSKDDVEEFKFLPKEQVLSQRLAWPESQPDMFRKYLEVS